LTSFTDGNIDGIDAGTSARKKEGSRTNSPTGKFGIDFFIKNGTEYKGVTDP